MNKKGNIKIHRKIIDWEWYKNCKVKSLFLHCLLKANWKDSKFEGIDVPRGSFVTSVKTLSDELSEKNNKFSVQSVRTALKHLISTKEITIKTTNKYTVITVNNYNLYQDVNKEANTQLTNSQQTTNNNRRNYKEINNKKRESKERESLYFIPPSLTDVIAYGIELGADKKYCEKFYDYYESLGWINGNGIAIKNWKLKFNNWFKKDLENGKFKKSDTSRRLD